VVVWPQRGGLLPDRRLPRHDVLLRAQAGERPVYSYRLSIIHFWALIFLYIWAGPHHLHYTALPDWAQTLGMVFSVMLWMPSWGGMINGLMTLNGAWDKMRTDPIMRMLVMSLAFYGMSTFEGPMMSVKPSTRSRTTPTGPSATCIPARWAGTAW
jgi:cbb3-type cytochrome c oxidase subunit I